MASKNVGKYTFDPGAKRTFKDYQRESIRIAEDFCYGDEVIEKIKAATTEDEISTVLRFARKSR